MNLYHIIIASAALLLASCGPDKEHVRIKGSFQNLSTAEFYIYQEENAECIDTVHIEGGKFSYDFPADDKCILTLLYPNFSRTYIIGEPGETVEISASAEHLLEADVSGTDANERFTRFRLSQIGKPEGNVLLAAQQYIRDNAADIDATAAFIAYFASSAEPPSREGLAMLDVLKKKQPKDKTVLSLDHRMRQQLSAAKGSMLPNVDIVMKDGEKKSLAEIRGGRPMLIVFAASWNYRSHEFLNVLRKVRRAYSPERLATLCVSLDLSRKQFDMIAERDSIPAPIAFDGLGFESPAAQSLAVRYVPGNIIVDARGRIVARDVEPDKISSEVERVL